MLFRRSEEKNTRETVKVKAWYDLHSHFLPGIDDGCKTPEESIQVLEISRKKGIAGMIATPHYYPEETINQFLERRAEAAGKLNHALAAGEYNIPKWCMGAEAAYYDGLVRAEGIEKLCLGKSRYLLLELPFERWGSNVIRDIFTLNNVYAITPIIAHLERYLDIQSKDMLQQLYEADVLIQMNGGYIVEKTRNASKRIRNGLVQVLGSDTHNLTTRRPNVREAVDKLRGEGLDEEMEEIRQTNKAIFTEAMGTQ